MATLQEMIAMGLTPDAIEKTYPKKAMPSSGEYEKLLLEQVNAQKSAIPELQEYVKAQNAQPVQTDLSPLMALTDTWTGSKLAQNYKSPETGTQRIKHMTDFQNMEQKQRDSIVDNLTKLVAGKNQGRAVETQMRQARSEEAAIAAYRKELGTSPAFKNYQESITAANGIDTMLKNPTAYGDLSTMFTFMKSLDPDSVVREGEQLLFRKTGSVTDKAANALNRFVSGQTLTPEQRQSVGELSKKLATNRRLTYEEFAKPTLEQARRRNFLEREIDPGFDHRSAPSVQQDTTIPTGATMRRKKPDGTWEYK